MLTEQQKAHILDIKDRLEALYEQVSDITSTDEFEAAPDDDRTALCQASDRLDEVIRKLVHFT